MDRPPTRKTHIIVGDGITALAFLENVNDRDVRDIVIVGRTASQLGRGAAYAKGREGTPWRFAYLLNSPADDIDVRFAAWLADRWPEVEAKMTDRKPDWLAAAAPLVAAGDVHGVNAPREFYGDFMQEQAAERIARLQAQGITVTLRDDTAVALEVTGDDVTVQTQAGVQITGQSVDVAPGGPSTMRIDGDDGPFSVPSLFGHEDRIVAQLKTGAEVFCIGGNAAMLDVLRLCQSVLPESALRFVACAPDGEIPAPLVPRLPRKLTTPNLSGGHADAQSFLAEIRHEIDRALAQGDEMREIRAGFRAHFLALPLAHYLSDVDEAQKVAGHLRFWLRGGTRDTILDMRRLAAAGKVRIVKGLVTGVTSTGDGAQVRVVDETGTAQTHRTGFVVNCAGAGPNSHFDPLTQDLLDQGLITRTSAKGGLKVGAGCRTRAPQIRYLSPAVSMIGAEVVAMPLYDAHMLRTYVGRSAEPARLDTPV